MIYVDEVQQVRPLWAGGGTAGSSHLISDESVKELLEFAERIGLRMHWFQPQSFPHFDLAPNYRRRAIAAGAVALDRVAFVAALRRGRDNLNARQVPPL
jgi:hypothetical protein